MPNVLIQCGRCWRLLAVVIVLALPDVAFAQQTRSQQAQPSILIGGYRVAIGMTVEQVNASLGSVFSASMIDSKSWMYRQGGRGVAKVFLENGRVSQIIKFFGVSSDAESIVDGQIRETKDAVEEFENLTRGLSCSRVIGDEYSGPAGGPGYQLDFRCGPYILNYAKWKFRDGEMASSTVIYVTR